MTQEMHLFFNDEDVAILRIALGLHPGAELKRDVALAAIRDDAPTGVMIAEWFLNKLPD